jgi:hypothetical protein
MGTCTYTYESYGKTVVEKTRTIKDNCKGIDRVWEPDIASPTDKTLGTCTYTYESYGKQKFELTHTFKTNCTGADRSWKESTLAEFQAEKAAKEGTGGGEKDDFVGPPDPNYHFLAPLPGMGPTFDPTQANNLGAYLNIMINLFIGICAVLAVIMIVVGGIEYMTTELISSKEEGKKRIMGAIYGLILALGAWTLLYQINPDLLNTDLTNLKNVTVTVTLDQQRIIDARSGKGNCAVVTDPNSACFPDKLKNDFTGTRNNAAPFNTLAAQASAICQLESNAVSNTPIGKSPNTFLDKCSDDKPFSFGLFQINAIAHRANIPACANAFEIPTGDGQSQGNCLKRDEKSGYCMQWSCKTKEPAYTACQNYLTNPINNIKYASSPKLSRWSSWTTYNSCKSKF